MPDILVEIFQSIVFFIPAYAANPGAVIFGGHGIIDRGKNFIDGRRIFGDGKSWSGYFGGILSGIFFYRLKNVSLGNYPSEFSAVGDQNCARILEHGIDHRNGA